jgi:hypothetical protein
MLKLGLNSTLGTLQICSYLNPRNTSNLFLTPGTLEPNPYSTLRCIEPNPKPILILWTSSMYPELNPNLIITEVLNYKLLV